MIRTALIVLVIAASACAPEVKKPARVQTIDVSVEARSAAAADAAREQFRTTVLQKYIEQQGMTVRGLVKALTAPKATTAKELQPAKFDLNAPTAAKLELVDGKVIYTVVAKPTAPTAAVISDGKTTYSVGYIVEAEVVPAAGELGAITVRQISEPHRVN
jgi:hypothetical protein